MQKTATSIKKRNFAEEKFCVLHFAFYVGLYGNDFTELNSQEETGGLKVLLIGFDLRSFDKRVLILRGF